MARIGLRNFRHAPLTEAKTYEECTYGTVESLGGAIECKVSLEKAEAELYTDDTLKEQASILKKGIITMGVDDDDDTIFAPILGQTEKEVTIGEGQIAEMVKEYTSKQDDIAVAQGFGHIVTKMVNGIRKFKVEFFPKVIFKTFIADAKTKGDSLEFTTPSIEGTVYALGDGTWEKHATFENEENAKKYLDELFLQAKMPVPPNEPGEGEEPVPPQVPV